MTRRESVDGGWLLVSQTHDGVKVRGAVGGVVAEEKAHTHRHRDAGHHPERRHGRRNVREGAHHEREEAADQDPDDAADAGKGDGFEEKLRADIVSARADSFADADFAGALRDGDQHAVHHADAAHQQADRADHTGEQRHGAGELVPKIEEQAGIGDLEIVIGIVGDVTAAAHGVDYLVLRAAEVHLGQHRKDQEDFADFRKYLAKSRERNARELIDAEAEDAAVLFEHADDFVQLAVHAHLFPDGVRVREQRFGDGVADYHDGARVGFIEVGNEAAGGDGEERDGGGVIGRGAADDHAFDPLVFVGDVVGLLGRRNALLEGNRDIDAAHGVLEILRVVDFEILAQADLLRQGSEAAHAGGNARDEKAARAEGEYARLHVSVESVDDSGDDDHAGHADHDSENGERGTGFAGAERVQSDVDVFPNIHELFRSQGDHRIELRRFHRGIEAEEQSDRRTQKHTEDRDPGLHRRGEGRQLPQRDGAEESAGHPDRHPDDALHDAFDYELLQHVAASRTDGAPDADLFGALADADQHDVHDHDSAHHRRDGADHQEDHEKGGADLLPQRDVAFRSADEEIVVLSGKDMAPAAQDAAGIVLREDEVGIGAVGFYADGEAVALPAVLQEGAQGDHDEIVLIAAEHAADFLEGADDGVFGAAGADGLAERAGIGKEFVQHPIADQTDFGGVQVLDLREVAAGGDGAGVDIGHGGRVAVNGDVVELVIQIVKRRAGVERSADVAAMRAVAGDGLHIGGVEEPVALGAVQNGEIDDGEWEAAHLKHIRSQIRDFLLDVKIGALNDGHHGDQSRHAHSDAEHRESSSQLMGADGVQRKRNVIPDPDHWWMSRFYRKTASGRDARAYQLVETQDEAVVDVGDRGGRALGADARRGGDYGAGGPQSDAIAGAAFADR